MYRLLERQSCLLKTYTTWGIESQCNRGNAPCIGVGRCGSCRSDLSPPGGVVHCVRHLIPLTHLLHRKCPPPHCIRRRDWCGCPASAWNADRVILCKTWIYYTTTGRHNPRLGRIRPRLVRNLPINVLWNYLLIVIVIIIL